VLKNADIVMILCWRQGSPQWVSNIFENNIQSFIQSWRTWFHKNTLKSVDIVMFLRLVPGSLLGKLLNRLKKHK